MTHGKEIVCKPERYAIINLAMAKVGRPTEYDPEFHCADFIKKSKRGKTITQIAGSWNIGRDTVWECGKKHPEFADTLKKGRELAEKWYMDLGQQAMIGQAKVGKKAVKVELGWHVWLTKNMFRWSDRQQTEITGADGKPLEATVNKLTDEQLEKKINELMNKKTAE